MYLKMFGIEIFVEIVPQLGKFVDWDFCSCDNHLWFGRAHFVFNRIGDKSENTNPTGATDESP